MKELEVMQARHFQVLREAIDAIERELKKYPIAEQLEISNPLKKSVVALFQQLDQQRTNRREEGDDILKDIL
jgi:cell division septum initiation protein DivIVA